MLATATNEDGRTPGISLPNSEAQQDLIRDAYQMAGVDPAETSYVEAHGTGTQAGRCHLNVLKMIPTKDD